MSTSPAVAVEMREKVFPGAPGRLIACPHLHLGSRGVSLHSHLARNEALLHNYSLLHHQRLWVHACRSGHYRVCPSFLDLGHTGHPL